MRIYGFTLFFGGYAVCFAALFLSSIHLLAIAELSVIAGFLLLFFSRKNKS